MAVGAGPFRARVAGGRSALLGTALIGAACTGPPRPATAPTPVPEAAVSRVDEQTYLRLRMLMVPVEGVRPSQVHDSYEETRAGSRIHHAIDILAPRGTPVLAADDGRVLRLRRNTLGGITIYAVDPSDRFVFYYAHLEGYAAGLAEGSAVGKGQVIGYVGTTGDAPANTPHLHFQLMRRQNEGRWWDGEPLDPTPYFALSGRGSN